MRGHKELPPGRDRGEQTALGLATPTAVTSVAPSSGKSPMRREDVPPSWGGPAVEQVPPQQHQLAQSAEFGKRALRHIRHENDSYYLVQFPLAKVLKLRYDIGVQRARTFDGIDPSIAALRRLAASLIYRRAACGCVGPHVWFCPDNVFAQTDYETAGI